MEKQSQCWHDSPQIHMVNHKETLPIKAKKHSDDSEKTFCILLRVLATDAFFGGPLADINGHPDKGLRHGVIKL